MNSESIKLIYLDASESLICSRALMIAQISAAKSDNLLEITVSDGKTSHRIPILWSVCIKSNVITLPISNFH